MKGKQDSVWIYRLNERWFLKPILIPHMVYVTDTHPGTLAHIDKGKHVKNPSVSRITDSSRNRFINADTECAGIGNRYFTEPLINNDSAAPIEISMDKGVRQALPQRFMDRGVINPHQVGINPKWSFHICRQPVNDLIIKIKDIAAPGAIAGTDPVRPAGII